MKPQIVALGCAVLLSACGDTRTADVARMAETGGTITLPDPKTGECYADDVTPAVIHTVTEQVVQQPAQTDDSGKVTTPAVYRTETRQMIVEERKTLRFEALCEAKIDRAFIENLQRALKARGFYDGPDNGKMNSGTRRAIRLYQIDQGIDSTILSHETAQQLGLIAIDGVKRG